MALFDVNLLFYHVTNTYGFTSGEFVNMAGQLATASSASTAINLGNARDLGIGMGQETPFVVAVVGTAFTCSSANLTINLQFQGSTNGVSYTTYTETGASSTASWPAGTQISFAVPPRITDPSQATQLVGLPLYYQLNMVFAGTANTVSVSTGTILAGISLAAPMDATTLGQYPSGFSVS